MRTLIDVIIPCYNDRASLIRCLRSLSMQSIGLDKFVVNIVDDGSDQEIESVLELVPTLNINFKKHKKNLGLPSALNTALDMSSNQYFVRVDCDDFVHECFLESFVWAFENKPNTMAIASDYKKVDTLERVISYHRAYDEPIGCGIMFRRVIINEIGKYDIEFLMAEDLDFLFRFKSKFQMEYLGICSYRYTQKAGTISTNKAEHESYKNLAHLKNLKRIENTNEK